LHLVVHSRAMRYSGCCGGRTTIGISCGFETLFSACTVLARGHV
jgi:hypothetical protein